MTSLQRKMSRKHGWRSERPQPTIFNEDGGYTTLHPTKGWRTVSAQRVEAQKRMMNLVV